MMIIDNFNNSIVLNISYSNKVILNYFYSSKKFYKFTLLYKFQFRIFRDTSKISSIPAIVLIL